MKPKIILLNILMLWPVLAPAATTLHYWTGNGGNGYWSNPNNWSGSVPTGGDQRVIFPNNAVRKGVTNNFIGSLTFESIWILGSGYTIANGSVGTDYLRADYPAGGISTFRTSISTTDDLYIIVDTNNSTLVVAGNIYLNNDNLILSSMGHGDVTLQGVVSGTGNVYKQSLGDLRLEGFGANTFVGTTLVTGGILRLNRYVLSGGFTFQGATAIPGDLVIGTGNGGLVSRIVVLDRDNQIADTSRVIVNGTGSLELSGEQDAIGALSLLAGTVTTGAGLLTLNGDVTVFAGVEPSVISGNLDLGGGSRRVFNVQSMAELHVPAVISGPAGMALVKTNRGDLFLSAANTYSGDTLLQLGALNLQGAGRPGNTVGGTYLEGGRLRLWTMLVNGESLTVQSVASVASEGAVSRWEGDVTLNSYLQVETAAGSQLQILGGIVGSGSLYKVGEGLLSLGGTSHNLYTGVTSIQQGTLELAKPIVGQPLIAINGPLMIGDGDNSPGLVLVRYLRSNQIADTTPVSLNKDATFNLNGWSDTVGNLDMEGGTILAGAGGLALNGNVNTSAADVPAVISGNLNLGDLPRHFYVADGAANPDLILNTRTSGGPQGDFIKMGDGKVKVTGDAHNTYSGATLVMAGSILLDKLPGLVAVPGDLIIGDDLGGFNADVVELAESEQIADFARVHINGSGFLGLGSHDETVGPLTLTGPGNAATGVGTLILNGNVHVAQSSWPATLSGKLSLGNVTRTFEVEDGLDAYDLAITASISGLGSAGLLKTGDGDLRLGGSNSFAGTVNVSSGSLTVWHSQALGATSAGTIMAHHTLLRLGLTVQIGAERLILGDQTHIHFHSPSNSWAGDILLNGQTILAAANYSVANQLELSGAISGPGSIVKSAGTVTFSGTQPNSYTGPTLVSEHVLILNKAPHVVAVPGALMVGNGALADTVRLQAPGQIADPAPVTMAVNAVLDLNHHDETVGSLAGAGTVQLGSGTLTTGLNDATTSYDGALLGSGGLIKTGTGEFQLMGPQSYSGSTRILSGSLRLDGSLASPLVDVAPTAMLTGAGTAQAVRVQPGGFLSPGPGVATFSINNELVMNQATLVCDLAGNGSDQLQVAGAIEISDAVLDLNSSAPPAPGADFMLINATGSAAITGVFHDMPESASFTHQGMVMEISYTAGTGNDVSLTSISTPPAAIQSIMKDSQGGMVLIGMGLPGIQYIVEATTNLDPPIVWIQLGTFQADNNGAYQFVDQDAPLFPRRFYRVMSP